MVTNYRARQPRLHDSECGAQNVGGDILGDKYDSSDLSPLNSSVETLSSGKLSGR